MAEFRGLEIVKISGAYYDPKTYTTLVFAPTTDDQGRRRYNVIVNGRLVDILAPKLKPGANLADRIISAEIRIAQEAQGRRLLERWVVCVGVGFHPDTRGADYVDADDNRVFTPDEAQLYDADVELAHKLCADVYWTALDLMIEKGFA